MKWIVSVILALVIHTIVWSQPSVGSRAKDIKLPDAGGSLVPLSSLKGKVVLVDFWASWCGPCRSSMPGLKQVYQKYKNKGLEIYGVSLDNNRSNWKQAVAEDRTPWVHVIDTEGKTAGQWAVSFIPSSFLLDKDGKIMAVNAEAEDLDRLLKKMLN